MSVYVKYRLGWYDLMALPSWLRRARAQIRDFGTGKWVASLVVMLTVQSALLLGAIDGYLWPSLGVLVEAATNIRLLAMSFIVMMVMIVAFDRIERWHPVMRTSVINVFRRHPAGDGSDNVVVWAAGAPVIGKAGLITLVVGVGYFATLEELYFRQLDNPMAEVLLPASVHEAFINYPLLGVVLWSVLAFGLAHLYSGASLGGCLALGLVGGGWFAWQYASGGILLAAVSHASYNLLAIGYMLSPRAQRSLNAAISAALVSFGRKPLGDPFQQRFASLPRAIHAPSWLKP